MKFRPTITILLSLCIVVLLSPSVTLAEEDGKIKVGAFYDNENFRNNSRGASYYGSYGGVLLGYEKQLDTFWWSTEGRYKYGQLNNESSKVNLAYIEGKGVVGKTFELSGLTVKPFIGLGLSWAAEDEVGYNDAYTTEYLLPIGLRVERNTDVGLFGVDLLYNYVLRREVYWTDGDPYWAKRNFGGSYNVEVGLYHEPASLPMGFRTYFKYEKWQASKIWASIERQHVGFETYVKF
ncbi:MAG TPA: hypothetical protein VN419_04250 [Humidesulfovibrio sp.]|uniref:hypothetical protein n=1 Tax=Humidesulfovibrio sp. TaxID=2910988 RepID=UPI002B6D8014|nr:hypothetical protein [Humidesulfovibrio sp.]HWR03212.1 hypothetical protein [Humidesulfovibrio sp.]